MKIQLDHNSHTYSLDLAQTGKTATLTIDGQTHAIEILRGGEDWLDIRVSASKSAFPSVPESVFTAYVSTDGPKRWVTVNGQTFVLTKTVGAAKRRGQSHHAAGELAAPMPGLVRAVQVAEGESVEKGQTLLILEAMKMEIKVAAPQTGKVKSLKVEPGQTVERDQLLVEIE